MKPATLILIATLAISCSGGSESPTAPTPTPTPTPVPAPTPSPTPTGALSGTWTGTVTATIGTANPRTPNNVSVVFDHSSDRVTGIMSPSQAIAGLTARFDLSADFAGTFTIMLGGRTAVFSGSMQVDIDVSTMTGTFSGTNTDGLPERNVFALRKQ